MLCSTVSRLNERISLRLSIYLSRNLLTLPTPVSSFSNTLLFSFILVWPYQFIVLPNTKLFNFLFLILSPLLTPIIAIRFSTYTALTLDFFLPFHTPVSESAAFREIAMQIIDSAIFYFYKRSDCPSDSPLIHYFVLT